MKQLLYSIIVLFLVSACEYTDSRPYIKELTDFSTFGLSAGDTILESKYEGIIPAHNYYLENERVGNDFWYGFIISSMTNLTKADSTNLYSSANGTGFSSTTSYAVVNASQPVSLWIDDTIGTARIDYIFLNNTYFTYSMMLNGTDYFKKFGGETDFDRDWMKVIIEAYDENEAFLGSTEAILADYTSDEFGEDYIVTDWLKVDLSQFGEIKKLTFSMQSTDTASTGEMKSPSFFCLDYLSIRKYLDEPLRKD